MRAAFVFPGQGSQAVGMVAAYCGYPQAAAAMAEAGEIVGADLTAMCAPDADSAALNQTINTQPALLAVCVGVYRAWIENGGARPAAMAGHSLGEWSALVCGGAIAFDAAVAVVRRRAALMQDAGGDGAMAAVLGVDAEIVADACAQASIDAQALTDAQSSTDGEQVAPANYNAPGQTVIAGHKNAVARAAELVKARGAKRVAPLPVSAAFHCEMMRPAMEKFAAVVERTEIKTPSIPVLQNAFSRAAADPAEIKQALIRQLCAPVDWMTIVADLAARADALVECGPGGVLSGLHKRIVPQTERYALRDGESLAAALAAIR